MPFNPLSGTIGFVQTVAGTTATTYPFDKWALDGPMNMPKVTNFNSEGAQQIVTGVYKGDVTLSGPVDAGNAPPWKIGMECSLFLGFNDTYGIVCTAKLANIGPSDDVNDAARLTLKWESNGVFGLSVL